jgi:hypothetical protein
MCSHGVTFVTTGYSASVKIDYIRYELLFECYMQLCRIHAYISLENLTFLYKRSYS